MSKKFRVSGVAVSKDNVKAGMCKVVYIGQDSQYYEAIEKDSVIESFILLDKSNINIVPTSKEQTEKMGNFAKGSPACLAYAMRSKDGTVRIAVAKSMPELGREIIKLVKRYHFDVKFHERFQDEIYKFFFYDIDENVILQFESCVANWKDVKPADCDMLSDYYKQIIMLYNGDEKCCGFEDPETGYQFLVVLLKDMALHIYSIKVESDEAVTVYPTKYYKCAGFDDEWKKFLDDYYKISDYDY